MNRIGSECGPENRLWDAPELPDDCENENSFFIDAAIAVMDIGLLILKRRIRLSRHKWSCSSATCPPTADMEETFSDLMNGLLGKWYLKGWDWLDGLFHETVDGSTHSLRLTCLKVVNLPSMLPPVEPNAEVDESDENYLRVLNVFEAIALILKGDQLPDLTNDPIPGLGDIMI